MQGPWGSGRGEREGHVVGAGGRAGGDRERERERGSVRGKLGYVMECSDLGVRNNVDFEGQHWSALLLTASGPLQMLDVATEDPRAFLKKE